MSIGGIDRNSSLESINRIGVADTATEEERSKGMSAQRNTPHRVRDVPASEDNPVGSSCPVAAVLRLFGGGCVAMVQDSGNCESPLAAGC